MADQLDEKWARLVAIAERLANQPAPTINVNVYPNVPKKKRPFDLGQAAKDTEVPEPGSRAPHPYVS